MTDEKDVIKNISTIYDSNTSLRILKDFERVLDELNLYVFANWENVELVRGPKVSRHWVECAFMWPKDEMPDPLGGKRLLDYNCKITYAKDTFAKPRKIEEPSDIRPNSKKGKMENHPIWIVTIKMPKQLMFEIFKGSVRGKKDDHVDLESLYGGIDTEQNMGEESVEMPQNEQPMAGDVNATS